MKLIVAGLFGAALACGGAPPPSPPVAGVIAIDVFSGREQPPPGEFAVRVGVPAVLRVVGLGPARVRVVGPNGAIVTTDALLHQELEYTIGGRVTDKRVRTIGTEQHFTPLEAGTYRALGDESGRVLAILKAQ